jgi:hypothetical protein
MALHIKAGGHRGSLNEGSRAEVRRRLHPHAKGRLGQELGLGHMSL